MDIGNQFNHPRYSITKPIGVGKSGQVWEVKSMANKIYAMKTFSDKSTWQREHSILKDIQAKLAKHPIGERFVGLEEYSSIFIDNTEIYFNILTLCKNDLEFHFKQMDVSEYPGQIIAILNTFILPGLKYLHESKICHGDIKAQNIMLRGKRWVLIDFASAGHVGDEATDYLYSPPEYSKLLDQGKKPKLTIQADAFALGMMIVDILSDFNYWNLVKSDRSGDQYQLPNYSGLGFELMSKVQDLVIKNPIKRISVSTFSEYSLIKAPVPPVSSKSQETGRLLNAIEKFGSGSKIVKDTPPTLQEASAKPSASNHQPIESIGIVTSGLTKNHSPVIDFQNVHSLGKLQPTPPSTGPRKSVIVGSDKSGYNSPKIAHREVIHNPVEPKLTLKPIIDFASTSSGSSSPKPIHTDVIPHKPVEPGSRRTSAAFVHRLSKIQRVPSVNTVIVADAVEESGQLFTPTPPPDASGRRNSALASPTTGKRSRSKKEISNLKRVNSNSTPLPVIPMRYHEFAAPLPDQDSEEDESERSEPLEIKSTVTTTNIGAAQNDFQITSLGTILSMKEDFNSRGSNDADAQLPQSLPQEYLENPLIKEGDVGNTAMINQFPSSLKNHCEETALLNDVMPNPQKMSNMASKPLTVNDVVVAHPFQPLMEPSENTELTSHSEKLLQQNTHERENNAKWLESALVNEIEKEKVLPIGSILETEQAIEVSEEPSLSSAIPKEFPEQKSPPPLISSIGTNTNLLTLERHDSITTTEVTQPNISPLASVTGRDGILSSTVSAPSSQTKSHYSMINPSLSKNTPAELRGSTASMTRGTPGKIRKAIPPPPSTKPGEPRPEGPKSMLSLQEIPAYRKGDASRLNEASKALPAVETLKTSPSTPQFPTIARDSAAPDQITPLPKVVPNPRQSMIIGVSAWTKEGFQDTTDISLQDRKSKNFDKSKRKSFQFFGSPKSETPPDNFDRTKRKSSFQFTGFGMFAEKVKTEATDNTLAKDEISSSSSADLPTIPIKFDDQVSMVRKLDGVNLSTTTALNGKSDLGSEIDVSIKKSVLLNESPVNSSQVRLNVPRNSEKLGIMSKEEIIKANEEHAKKLRQLVPPETDLRPISDTLLVTEPIYVTGDQTVLIVTMPQRGVELVTSVTEAFTGNLLFQIDDKHENSRMVRTALGKVLCNWNAKTKMTMKKKINAADSARTTLLDVTKSLTANSYIISGKNIANNSKFSITVVGNLQQKTARATLDGKSGQVIANFVENTLKPHGKISYIATVAGGVDFALITIICAALEEYVLRTPNIEGFKDRRLSEMLPLSRNLVATSPLQVAADLTNIIISIPNIGSQTETVEKEETKEPLLSIDCTQKHKTVLRKMSGEAICSLRIKTDSTEVGTVYAGEKTETKLLTIKNNSPILSTKLTVTGNNLLDKSSYTICVKGNWASKGNILMTMNDKYGPIVATLSLPSTLAAKTKIFNASVVQGVDMALVVMISIALDQFSKTVF